MTAPSALCGCGCGTPVARRYAPGHDARHKSALKTALVEGTWREQAAAADLLADLGWAHFADPADLRAVPYRGPRGQALPLVGEVTRWQVTPSGRHHCDRRCSALTREAREAGALGPVTRLARDSWLTLVDSTPDLVARLASSWDYCPECSSEHTREVLAEHERVSQVVNLMTSPDYEPRQYRKTPPAEWEVEGLDGQLIRVTRTRSGVLTHHRPPAAWVPPTGLPTLPPPNPADYLKPRVA